MADETLDPGEFRLGKRVFSGSSSGSVYFGTNTSGENIVIKLEPVKAKNPGLEYESIVYQALAGGVGVPTVRRFTADHGCNIMILDQLGPSLKDLLNIHSKFSLKTVLLLADQLISRITYIHACGFIHGDVEPGNFLMGIGPRSNEVNVIDFGCSRRFMDAKTHVHIPYEESKKQGKNALFASISTQSGVVPTRRDDLESLAYVLIYFLRGALPWQNLRDATHKQTYHRILESKKTVSTDVVCRGLPNEFGTFLNHSRALRFDENPNYAYLHQIFRELFTREGYQYDYNFDWSPRINIRTACLMCLGCPKNGRYDFCAETCRDWAMSMAPWLLEVPSGHATFETVERKFKNSWKHPKKDPCPQVRKVHRIIESPSLSAKYQEYGAKYGNECFRYHGTKRECKLGDPGNLNPCMSTTCAVCSIIRTSFKVKLAHPGGAFGQGIYTSSASNKSASYSDFPDGIMFVSKVVLGNVRNVTRFNEVLSCPSGYNSVVFDRYNGQLNETVVYNDQAIKPVFLIVFG